MDDSKAIPNPVFDTLISEDWKEEEVYSNERKVYLELNL